jgi:hypothetical protein
MLDAQLDRSVSAMLEDDPAFADYLIDNGPLIDAERGDLSLLIDRLEKGIATSAEQAFIAKFLQPKTKGRRKLSMDERREGTMMMDKKPFDKTMVWIAAEDTRSIQGLFRAYYGRSDKERAMEYAARRWSDTPERAVELISVIDVALRRPKSRSMIDRRKLR